MPIGKAYFGFTDAELKELDKWVRSHTVQSFGPVREVEKQLVFEVAFDSAQISGRHKSGVGAPTGLSAFGGPTQHSRAGLMNDGPPGLLLECSIQKAETPKPNAKS